MERKHRFHYFIEKRRYACYEPWCVYLWDRQSLVRGQANFRRLWSSHRTHQEAVNSVVSEISQMSAKRSKRNKEQKDIVVDSI